MSRSILVLSVAGAIASPVILGYLAIHMFREIRRNLAFDARLGVPRGWALRFAPKMEERRDSEGSRGFRALGLALVKAASVLAPVGAGEREKLAAMLRAAGFGQRDALSYFLSAKLGTGAVLAAAAGYLSSNIEMIGRYGVLVALMALAGLVVGMVVPEYALRARVSRRLRGMGAALPDALDLMVMSLESGLTFERGLATVAEELTPIEPNLAAEFRLIEAELRLGANRRTVLHEFHGRTQVEGLKDLAMTLIQSERYGTPLTQSMKNIAAAERTQRAARIAARAERLPVLMTLPMLLLVVPGTMLLIAGPAVLGAIRSLGSLGGG